MFYGIVFNHNRLFLLEINVKLLNLSNTNLRRNIRRLSLKLVKERDRAYYLSLSSKIDKENSVPSNTP